MELVEIKNDITNEVVVTKSNLCTDLLQTLGKQKGKDGAIHSCVSKLIIS